MSKQAFDRKLAELETLRGASPEDAVAPLARPLKDRSGFLVSKAAAIVEDRRVTALIPDLIAAFERFLRDPVKSDPQCWAKNAIVKALAALDHADPAVFLRGIAHVQLEAVWGGSVDTAATLRGACALALVACHIDSFRLLTLFADLLTDAEKSARIDAARAIAQLGADGGVLLLRLKVRVGDPEPEVTGHCFAALLSLAPREYLDFVAGFLEHDDADVRIEAAGALAESREPESVGHLKEFWNRQVAPEVRLTLVSLLAGSPLLEASEFLVTVIGEARQAIAGEALQALSRSRYAAQLLDQAKITYQARFPIG